MIHKPSNESLSVGVPLTGSMSGENGDGTYIRHTMIRLPYRPAVSVGYETDGGT